MRLSKIGELSLIEKIRKRFDRKSKHIIVGIGDDAAVIRPRDKNLLFTTDMMVEGIHFDLRFTTPYQLGFKLVSVNVSDIYAMGGIPQYLLLNIAMNKSTDELFINRFFDGIDDAMELYDINLIGGDLSSAKKGMVIAASLTGYTVKPVRRSGAKPGDKIYVTGNLGDSACGLKILKRIKKPVPIDDIPSRALPTRTYELSQLGLPWNTVKPLLKRHLMPEARDPKCFARFATSMIDISDGLFIDLSRLCNESKVGTEIYMHHIPVSTQMKKTAAMLKIDPFKLATSGGEDYELLFTAHPASPKPNAGNIKITCIGKITKKNRIVVYPTGKEVELKAEGYRHFGTQR